MFSLARRNHQIEENNRRANENNRDGVTETPKCPNPGGPGKRALTAHDGRYGDDVVRVRGMPHAQEKTDREDGKSTHHKRPVRGLALATA